MIKKARSLKLKNSIFMVKDILKYNSSEKYDAIIAFDSLWHIEYSSQTQIYKILSNLLKKNGYLIFTHGKKDSIVISEMFGEKFYYSALDIEMVLTLLKQNGFTIITLIENYEEETTGNRDLLIIAKKFS